MGAEQDDTTRPAASRSIAILREILAEIGMTLEHQPGRESYTIRDMDREGQQPEAPDVNR